MRKRTVLVALAVGFALLVGTVALGATNPEYVPIEHQQYVLQDNVEDSLFIFVLSMRNLEFFEVHVEAFEMAGKLLGVQTRVMGPAEFDTDAQISAFMTAIALEPDGIITYPPGPELGPVIDEATRAGIPVVTVTGDVPESSRIAFVGIDQYEVGVIGGEFLAEVLGGVGKVGVLSITMPMFQLREDGYRDTLAEYPGIEIVATGDTQADFPTGITVAKSILEAHPDLDAFVCVDSVGAMSAVIAIREAGLTGKVQVMGMDRNNDVVEHVRDGYILASVAQKSHLHTYYAMMILYNLKHNPMPITTDNIAAGVTAAPTWINPGLELVTPDNWQYWVR